MCKVNCASYVKQMMQSPDSPARNAPEMCGNKDLIRPGDSTEKPEVPHGSQDGRNVKDA